MKGVIKIVKINDLGIYILDSLFRCELEEAVPWFGHELSNYCHISNPHFSKEHTMQVFSTNKDACTASFLHSRQLQCSAVVECHQFKRFANPKTGSVARSHS